MSPFLTNIRNFSGERVAALDAAERVRMIQRFSSCECMDALDVPGLQRTVKAAIERRLRYLRSHGGG